MKSILKCLAVLLIAELSAQVYVPAIAQQQHAIHFVNAFSQAQDKRIEADKKLVLNMEAAADWLVNFKTQKGHFPEPGVEQDKGTVFLQKNIMKPNPYSATGVMSQSEIRPCSIHFYSDLGLIDVRRQEWQKSPPSSWRGEPGSINIILGWQKYFLIWGAGADQLPIFDAKNNKYWLVWREFAD